MREGDRVSTTLPPGIDFAALLHSCALLGAVFVPLGTRLTGGELARQRDAAAAKVEVGEPLAGEEARIEPRPEVDPDAVQLVLFTSGTSAAPKPVPLTFANQSASASAVASAIGGPRPDDRWLCVLPLFHIAGLAILIRSAIWRTTAVVRPGFEAAAAKADLEQGDITLVSLVATMLRRLREAGLDRAPALRAAMVGGGPVPADLLEWAHAAGIPACANYGMTETASQVVSSAPGEPGVAGLALEGVELRIAADGEILVRGAMVCAAAAGPDGWLRTRDRGRLDADGRLHVEGRIEDTIVSGGENVAPEEVEEVLTAHPGVADAGVVGVPDPEWGQAVTAFVVPAGPGAPRDGDLREWCRERLAPHKVPKRFTAVHELPRTASGKLQRSRLREGGPPASDGV